MLTGPGRHVQLQQLGPLPRHGPVHRRAGWRRARRRARSGPASRSASGRTESSIEYRSRGRADRCRARPRSSLAAPLLAAAWARASRSRLNFGPGDAPYLSGFTSEYEIDDRSATHWTTYDAAVALPLTVSGEPDGARRTASLRVFRRDGAWSRSSFGGACRRPVRVPRRPLPRAQRRRWELRGPTPVAVAIARTRTSGRTCGLKLDWVRLTLGPGPDRRLSGWARWFRAVARRRSPRRPAPARGLGPAPRARCSAAPWCGRRRWRAASTIPGSSTACCAGVVPGSGALRPGGRGARPRASRRARRAAAADVRSAGRLGLAAFLRACARGEPSRLLLPRPAHARAAWSRVVRAAGLDFFRTPAACDLGARRVADRGLRPHLRVSRTHRPSTCRSRLIACRLRRRSPRR